MSITNGVALFQGNQSNGIVSGVDFQPAQVTTLNVNSLSGPIQPANAVSGIYFQNSGAGNVTINAGLSGSNIVINTTGAAGINAGSVGSPPANPPDDPFLGIPIPTNSTVAGGVVQVQSHSDITTEGDNAAGIVATSQTTGYSPTVIQQLESFTRVQHHLHGDWGDECRRHRTPQLAARSRARSLIPMAIRSPVTEERL